MEERFGINKASGEEILSMALLVYPTKSKQVFSKPSASNMIDGNRVEDFEYLMEVFVNNTSANREMFFTNTLVKKIWNEVARSLLKKDCFKQSVPKKELHNTYCKISETVR